MTAPSRSDILAATEVIAAAARAEILPRWAFQQVAKIKAEIRARDQSIENAFDQWAALAFPWLPDHSHSIAQMRAAWLAGAKWAGETATVSITEAAR